MIAVLKADARKIPRLDTDAIQVFAMKPQSVPVGNRSGGVGTTHSSHRRTPPALAGRGCFDSNGRGFVFSKPKQGARLLFLDTKKRKQDEANLGSAKIAGLVTEERTTVCGAGLVFVVPAAEGLGKETDCIFFDHADLNALMVARIHTASQILVRLRLFDSNVGFPVGKSGEVGKNFVGLHLPTNTTQGGLSQYGGNRPC
ncbi:hypothetical protein LCGC14_2355530 [marine sediment metagenome]|uniref:Uncharacterized protein n=1 Tax=marine sediment metagenome TaxID=412755 RepID=A0A0F9C8G8_9ZZZZ